VSKLRALSPLMLIWSLIGVKLRLICRQST